jgi:mono/diheme cytochrome c family protein
MKSYISHISKFIFLTLILLILSFGMVVYAYYDSSKPVIEEAQFYCGVDYIKSEPLVDTPEKALGEQIFKNNCATCHATTDEVVVGPGLKGILERRPIEWIIKWVNNPQKVIKSGDKYAVDLYEKFNHAEMTPYPNLKREEIVSILAYIDNQ